MTKIVHDASSKLWKVICPEHGELARFAKYWTAQRDAKQHDEVWHT